MYITAFISYTLLLKWRKQQPCNIGNKPAKSQNAPGAAAKGGAGGRLAHGWWPWRVPPSLLKKKISSSNFLENNIMHLKFVFLVLKTIS